MTRYYSQKSLIYAKNLRTDQTDCENILWQYLRGKRLNNIKFRRQVPIGKYIVDFVNLGKKLVIEIDGSQHIDEKYIEYDKTRTEFLNLNGYKVIRFFDNDVINNIEEVLNSIIETYNNIE